MSTTSLFFDIFARDLNTKETFAGIEAAGAGMGKGISRALAPLGLAFAGLGIADVVGHMIKDAGDFEAATTRLATSAGEDVANLKMVGDGILQVASDTGTATGELQKAAYYIESAGYHGADMLTILKAAAEGAKAEGSDVATVGDAVTSALRDYHLNASDAADVTSKLITATSDGKTTFELFAGSLHSVLPTAAAAHISLNDVLGDLASLTVHGMTADQATQDLNHTIMKLINPTQQETSEFALLGTSAQEVQSKLGSGGLSGALDFLHDKIVKSMPAGADKVLLDFGTALQKVSPDVQKLGTAMMDGSISYKQFLTSAKALTPEEYEQAKALVTLLGETHKIGTEQMTGDKVLQTYAQAWRLATGDQTAAGTAIKLTGENAEYTHKAINDVAKATKDANGDVKGWSEIQGTFNNKLDRFKETLGVIGIKIGEKLLPALGDALTGFTNFINKVAPMLSGLWEKDIQPALDHIAGSFLNTFGNGSGGGGTTGDAADGFGSSMKKVGDNAGHTLGTGGSVDQAAQQFGKTMQGLADSIKTFTDALPQLDAAANNVENAVNDSGVATHNYIVTMVEEWNTGIDTVLLKTEGIRWQIIAAFADAGSWLIRVGPMLIGGLVAGIQSAVAGPLADALAGVSQFIKDHKGPESYDRVMLKPHGGWIMAGLIDGLEGGLPQLGLSLAKVSAKITSHDMTPAWGTGSPFAPAGSSARALRLVVDGHEFKAYVDDRAGAAVNAADRRFSRRGSR